MSSPVSQEDHHRNNSCFRRIWNLFLEHFVCIEPQDEFTQTIRKFMAAVLVPFSTAFIAFASYFIHLISTDHEPTAALIILICICLAGGCGVFICHYLLLRKWRHISDNHQSFMNWFYVVAWGIILFCYPEANHPAIIGTVTLTIAVSGRQTGSQVGFYCQYFIMLAQAFVDSYNRAILLSVTTMKENEGSGGDSVVVSTSNITNTTTTASSCSFQYFAPLISLPNPEIRQSFTLLLFMNLSGTLGLFAVIFAVKAQASYSNRVLTKATNTNRLAGKVMERLKRYDTDRATDVLHRQHRHMEQEQLEDLDEVVVDETMAGTLKAMIVNLETFRPFLPNYIFLSLRSDSSGGEEEDEDDEGTLGRAGSSSAGGRVARYEEVSDAVSDATSIRSGRNRRAGGYRGRALRGGQQHKFNDGASSASGRQSISSASTVLTTQSYVGGAGGPPRGLQEAEMASIFKISLCWVELLPHRFILSEKSSPPVETHASSGGDAAAASLPGQPMLVLPPVTTSATTPSPVSSPTMMMMSSALLHQTANLLTSFVDLVYDVANQTKASVHSMLGDQVQLSWNATHRVAQPEVKACQFLLRLKDRVGAYNNKKGQGSGGPAGVLPEVAGAAASGRASIYNLTSTSTKQRALVLDASWRPALRGSLALAQRTSRSATEGGGRGVCIVDEVTSKSAGHQIEVSAADQVRFTPATHSSLGEDCLMHTENTRPPFSFLCDGKSSSSLKVSSSGDPKDDDGVLPSSSSFNSCRLLFELIAETGQDEQEWMYQLQDQEKKAGVSSVFNEALELWTMTTTPTTVSQGTTLQSEKEKFLQKLEGLINSPYSSSVDDLTLLQRRLYNWLKS